MSLYLRAFEKSSIVSLYLIRKHLYFTIFCLQCYEFFRFLLIPFIFVYDLVKFNLVYHTSYTMWYNWVHVIAPFIVENKTKVLLDHFLLLKTQKTCLLWWNSQSYFIFSIRNTVTRYVLRWYSKHVLWIKRWVRISTPCTKYLVFNIVLDAK